MGHDRARLSPLRRPGGAVGHPFHVRDLRKPVHARPHGHLRLRRAAWRGAEGIGQRAFHLRFEPREGAEQPGGHRRSLRGVGLFLDHSLTQGVV